MLFKVYFGKQILKNYIQIAATTVYSERRLEIGIGPARAKQGKQDVNCSDEPCQVIRRLGSILRY